MSHCTTLPELSTANMKIIDDYIGGHDWRIKGNANIGYSFGGLILHIAGKISAEYWLTKVYDWEISKAHIEGDIQIHDLDFICAYCAGWSLRDLIQEGFGGVEGKINAGPAKHFSSILGQIVNFLGTLQNEWAGAQAFSSFDTYLAPFVRLDNLSQDVVRQELQEFLFALNVSSRWGMQTPFTNLTFDLVVPKSMKDQHPIIGGKILDETYADFQKEMDMINEAYLDLMIKGDSDGRIFSFPIPTYNITNDFNWNSKVAEKIFTMTAKYGVPYFQNFINSDLDPEDVRSLCCRLRLDKRELLKRGGGLFGSAELTGSIGVCTLNCSRIGYVSKGKPVSALLEEVDRLLDISIRSLEKKRVYLNERLESGLYPFTSRYMKRGYNNHFSTIGINGVNEMVRNYTNDQYSIADKYGKELATLVLDYINKKLVTVQESTGNLYNLEATPAEGCTYRFAKADKRRFGDDIITAGTADAPYYTNSTQLPVGYTDDPIEALDHQESLQRLYTGGTVFHLYLGESIGWESCRDLVKRILSNYKIPYLSITPTFSICPEHGYINGEVQICERCGNECEIWTRVVGFYRPVNNYNVGKKQEFDDRKVYCPHCGT